MVADVQADLVFTLWMSGRNVMMMEPVDVEILNVGAVCTRCGRLGNIREQASVSRMSVNVLRTGRACRTDCVSEDVDLWTSANVHDLPHFTTMKLEDAMKRVVHLHSVPEAMAAVSYAPFPCCKCTKFCWRGSCTTAWCTSPSVRLWWALLDFAMQQSHSDIDNR